MVGVLVCKNDGSFELEAADVPPAALVSWDALKMHLARVLYCEEELFAVAAAAEVALYRLPDGESVAELVHALRTPGVSSSTISSINDRSALRGVSEAAEVDEDVDDTAAGDDERAQIAVLVTPESRWVLDIFGAPMRRTCDLAQQTDYALRGVRKSSLAPPGGRCAAVLQEVDALTADCAVAWCGLGAWFASCRRVSAMSSPPTSTSTIGTVLHGATLSTSCALGNERFVDSSGFSAAPASAYSEPYIHIGTWVPLMVTDKVKGALGGATGAVGGGSSTSTSSLLSHVLKPLASEYEDVLVTTNRAREYISRFRRAGRPVTIHSIQTTLLPLAVASPNAISHQGPRVLYEGVYTLSEAEAQRGFIQAVRLWFSFDCEQTVSVTKVHGALGLKPLRQQDGWIVVQALPGSPAFDAGMRGDEAFLTHVNGVDVSPHAFPAVGSSTKQSQQQQQQSANGQTHVSWKESVIPLVDKCETCIFTFF